MEDISWFIISSKLLEIHQGETTRQTTAVMCVIPVAAPPRSEREVILKRTSQANKPRTAIDTNTHKQTQQDVVSRRLYVRRPTLLPHFCLCVVSGRANEWMLFTWLNNTCMTLNWRWLAVDTWSPLLRKCFPYVCRWNWGVRIESAPLYSDPL